MTNDRLTARQAASQLGISDQELRTALREFKDVLPPRDPEYPDLLPKELVDGLRAVITPADISPMSAEPPRVRGSSGEKDGARIFAITSGKGGVGKTSTCVNLATEFATRGHRTIVVDVDLGLANAHIVAGVKPQATLMDYLEGRAPLADIVVDGVGGVKFISGGSGVKELADLDDSGRQRITTAIDELRPFCDVVLLDTAAGISNSVVDFVSIADQTLLVTTSNFAAIADAYGIVKVLIQGGYRNPVQLIVNRVRSPEEAEQVFKKLKGCTERFLSFDLNWLGLLPEDQSVEGAVLKRKPFCEAFPGSVATRYLKKLASALERYLPTAASRA